MTVELTPAADHSAPTPTSRGSRRFGTLLGGVNIVGDVLPLTALLALIVFFSVRAEAFLTPANLTLITGQAGILLLASLGATLVIVAGSVDLSVGSIALLTGAVLASLINAGIGNPVVILAVSVAVGAAIGLLNGVVFAHGRVPSFIATLGTLSLFAGIGLTVLQGSTINFTNQTIRDLAIGGDASFFHNLGSAALPGGFPEEGIWALVLLALFGFMLRRTLFGFRLKAIGGSRAAAAVVRLPVTRYIFLAFIMCAVMACLAGLLDMSFVGSASPNDGQADLFPVFAAVIIGGASLARGKGSAIGTLGGALLLAVLANGFALIAAGPFASQILLGTVTVGAVVIDRFTSRRTT